MKNLQKNKNEESIKNLNSTYYRLVDNAQMGEIFKVLVVSCL
jgi:SAM-dependent MidA family methyltransferase